MSESAFDGRKNFTADDEIEKMLEEHFSTFGITHREVWRNFAIYSRRIFLKRFLALYELYRMVMDLPGDVVELGVYRGASLMAFANFMEIRNMGDRHRRVFGFDNFQGFGEFDAKDGAERPEVGKKVGGFKSEDFEKPLRDAIRIFDADRFIPYKARVELIKGNIEQTVPTFVAENPGVRICLLHFDADLYRPSLVALEHLWPLVVPGGIVAFDEYGIPPWEGESRAVDEFFKDKRVQLQRFSWTSNPGAYLIKT